MKKKTSWLKQNFSEILTEKTWDFLIETTTHFKNADRKKSVTLGLR